MEAKGRKFMAGRTVNNIKCYREGQGRWKLKSITRFSSMEVTGDFKKSPLFGWLGQDWETRNGDDSLEKFGYKREREMGMTRWVEGGFVLLCF